MLQYEGDAEGMSLPLVHTEYIRTIETCEGGRPTDVQKPIVCNLLKAFKGRLKLHLN